MDLVFRLCDDEGSCVDVDLDILGLELEGRVIEIHLDDVQYVKDQLDEAADKLEG